MKVKSSKSDTLKITNVDYSIEAPNFSISIGFYSNKNHNLRILMF
jgi:hypothetical protein